MSARRAVVVVLGITLLLAGWTAQAKHVSDVYQAKIPVAGQSASERRDALRQALEEVLVKATGDRQAARMPTLAAALSDATRYVQQYGYETAPLDSAVAFEGVSAGKGRELLVVSFDARAVNALIREAGLPLWGQNRPVTLVWIAIKDTGSRGLLGDGPWLELREALEVQAQRRGLPVVFPLLDLQDRGRMNFIDVWGNFREAVLEGSSRYQADNVVVGRVSRTAQGQWMASWTLYLGPESLDWSTPAGESAQVMAAGIDNVADAVAAVYAQHNFAGGRSLAQISVTDVRALDDYGRTLTFLAGLEQVEDAQLARLNADSAVFRLTFHGDLERLAETLALGGTLTPFNAPSPVTPVEGGTVDPPATLYYRLLP